MTLKTLSAILLLGLWMALPATIASGASPFREAEACRDRLVLSREKQRHQSWERCIELYRTTPSFKREDGRAAYEMARLYEERHKYFGQSNDLKNAKHYYQMVLAASPRSYFYLDAKRQLTQLNPTARLSAKRSDQAADQNSQVTKKSPPPLLPKSPPSKQPPEEAAGDNSRVRLLNIRHNHYPDYTRVVFDLDSATPYRASRLPGSQTLLVQMDRTAVDTLVQKRLPLFNKLTALKKVQVNPQKDGRLEVRLTFKTLGPYKLIPLGNPDRLVIDVFHTAHVSPELLQEEFRSPVRVAPPPPGIKTIVIDSGHGGKDSGAIGPTGLTEKEVVLDVSLRLRDLLRRKLKKTVIMTRDQDVFIPLSDRTALANTKKADLFVSIHANAHPKRETHGIEVYLMGQATDETAAATAARENSDPEKAQGSFQEEILSDLQSDFNFNSSLEMAHLTETALLEKLSKKYATISLGVKRAPFYVLAKAEMPAILAEISFLSNHQEEKRLKSRHYRQAIAEAIYNGIERYIRVAKVRINGKHD